MKEEIYQQLEKTAFTVFLVCLLKCIVNHFERKQWDRLTNGTYKGFMKGVVRTGF